MKIFLASKALQIIGFGLMKQFSSILKLVSSILTSSLRDTQKNICPILKRQTRMEENIGNGVKKSDAILMSTWKKKEPQSGMCGI